MIILYMAYNLAILCHTCIILYMLLYGTNGTSTCWILKLPYGHRGQLLGPLSNLFGEDLGENVKL